MRGLNLVLLAGVFFWYSLFLMQGTGDITLFLKSISVLQDEGVIQGYKRFVASHPGMVGSAIVRNLQSKSYNNIVTRTHSELDLTNQDAVQAFFEKERPEQVYLAAAKVGGVYTANTFPAEFIYQNLMMQNNVIHQAFLAGVRNFFFSDPAVFILSSLRSLWRRILY